MLARVPIQAWTKPRVAETSQRRRNRRESTREYSNPPRLNLARRRILRCRLSVAYTSNRGGQLSAVQGFGNRARCESNLRRIRTEAARLDELPWEVRLDRLLLPEPKVLELPGHSAFNRT